jgi:hypothetical protein
VHADGDDAKSLLQLLLDRPVQDELVRNSFVARLVRQPWTNAKV